MTPIEYLRIMYEIRNNPMNNPTLTTEYAKFSSMNTESCHNLGGTRNDEAAISFTRQSSLNSTTAKSPRTA
ncbi:hypothetical protein Ahy_B06g086040 isoform B [Arachis hypogaea]|uniref:Uncharacterized protein n=1 Tax=Arachis hypogaea TaxID=3818 RepID=A0A444YWH1_ARAHY|nr:hypothetical protein Ahy_B06g086040 isoform B [Arachis hypogaea]